MAYDDLLQQVSAKPFFRRMFAIFFFNAFPDAFAVATVALVLFVPDKFRCSFPEDVEEYLKQNSSALNATLDFFIPFDYEKNSYSRCSIYSRTDEEISNFIKNQSIFSYNQNSNMSSLNVKSCEGNYDFGEYPQQGLMSAPMEFNYLCENDWVIPLFMLMFFLGKFATGIVGLLADRFGRRPTYIFLTLLVFVTLLLQSFANSTWMFAIAFIFSGISSATNFLVGFVISGEYTTPQYRNFLSIPWFLGFSSGYLLTSFIGYLTPDWRWLVRVSSAFGLLYLSNIWFIKETPRWLMANGKTKEARKVFAYIAKCSNVKLSKGFFDQVEKEARCLTLEEGEKNNSQKMGMWKTFVQMYKMPRMVVIVFVLCASWFANYLIYYGMSLNVQSLAGNLYLNNALMGLVDVPGLLTAYLGVKYFSRPLWHGLTLISCAGFCLIAALLSNVNPVASSAAALAGKSFIAGSFFLIYIHTIEVFPTVIRSSYMNILSSLGIIGLFISPYLAHMGKLQGEKVPYIIMSSITAMSGLAVLLFSPETNKIELPENIGDVLKMKRFSFGRCCRVKKISKMKENISEQSSNSQLNVL